VETDKATMSLDSIEDGFIAKLLVDEGAADIPVGQPILIMVEDEADIAAFADYTPPAEAAAPAAAAAAPAETPSSPPAPTSAPAAVAATSAAPPAPAAAPTGDRIFASPLAKRLAAAADIALSSLSGTGPRGRITKADVDAYVAAPPATAAAATAVAATAAGTEGASFTDEKLSSVRKIIASRLLESKQTIPHYYLEIDVNVDRVMALRQRLNASADGAYKLSVNDFIVKASAKALQKVPEVNSAWMDSFIRQYNTVDISVAVSTPNGLITPIVFDADAKGLAEISADVKSLAARAREGGLAPAEFQGGTFTISNLGMFGVKSFSAIINPPQSCILAVSLLPVLPLPPPSFSFLSEACRPLCRAASK